jgi:cell division protein FtsL
MRPTSIIWLGVILMTGVAVFTVKSNVARLEEELLRVRKEIVHDQQAMHVLNAEWSYLNKPSRLAELAKRHLPLLQPIATVQYAGLDRLEQIPWKPGEEPTASAPATPSATGPTVASIQPLPTPVAATPAPGQKRPR